VPLAVDTSHHAGQSSGRDRLLSSGSFCRPASGMKGRRTKLQITRLFCKPICKPDAARHFETGEAEPDEARRDLSCPPRSPRPRETVRDGGDAHRTAHNPATIVLTPSCASTARRTGQQRITRGPFPRSNGLTCTDSLADGTGSTGCAGISQPPVPRPVPRTVRG
jgi:hypothetical protein